MIPFTNFFNKTQETSSLSEVPRKVMGMHTSVQGLPEHKPYGFWVDRSGNFRIVPYQSHAETSIEVLEAANQWLQKHGKDLIKVNAYDTLWNDGWIRIVISYNTVYYQTKEKLVKPTHSQLKFVKFLQELYNVENLENSRGD